VPNIPAIRRLVSTAWAALIASNCRTVLNSINPWTWYQITAIFSFKANALPQVQQSSASTNFQVPVLFSDLQYAALSVSNADQRQQSGPGATDLRGAANFECGRRFTLGRQYRSHGHLHPFHDYHQQSLSRRGRARGNSGFVSGALRLYINGVRVGTVNGIGAIYQNPQRPSRIQPGIRDGLHRPGQDHQSRIGHRDNFLRRTAQCVH